MLLQGHAVLPSPGDVGREGRSAERVAAELGDGSLRDDVFVVRLRHQGRGREEVVLGSDAVVEERELDLVNRIVDGDCLMILRHGRKV